MLRGLGALDDRILSLCLGLPYCGNFTLVFIERCSAFLRPVHVAKRCVTLFRDVLLHVLHLGPISWRKLSGKGCTVCAAARNLGSFVLDDVCRRRNIRAQGFMLLDGGSMHGLSRRNNALSDRKDRASSSSFPESSAARFCDFSSHFMALAKHTSLSLASHPHHSLQLCVHGIPVAGQLFSRFLRSGTLLLLLLHVLSSATSCTVSCFRTVSATLDTDFSFVALIIWTSRGTRSTLSTSAGTPQLFLLQSHVLCARPFFITRRSRTGVTIDLVNITHWNARLPPGQSCSFSQAWQISLSLAVDFNSKPLSHSQV